MPLMDRDMEGQGSKTRDKSPYKNITDDKTEQMMRDLIRKRGILKGRLTKFANYLNSIITPLRTESRIDLKLRMDGAGILFSEFNNIQSKLEDTVPDCDIDDQLDQRQQFEDCYYSTLSKAESILGVSGEVADCSNVCSHKHSSVKLPIITLPTFDGLYEHWLEYRDTYLSLVHNSTDISNIQKFHYLKSSLKGSAELVINSIEISSENYSVAWELLLNRYDNTRLLVQSHVKALFSIQPLPKESSTLIRKLIDIIVNNLRALKTLGEPTDHWDTLIIYIVTCKLDKTTERQWEEHKGSLLSNANSKITLKVDHLIKFLKTRADLLETLILSHSKDNTNTDSNKKCSSAVRPNITHCNISSNKPASRSSRRLCVVCKASHPIYTCSQFIGMDLKSKLKIIKEHNLCENCLRPGHTISSCLFGPCKKCNLKHNSLIHPNDSYTTSIAQPLTVSVSSEASAGDASMHPHSASCDRSDKSQFFQVSNVHASTHTDINCINVQPVLLSTALVEIPDRYNKYHIACALLDSGSQSCFITHSFCKKLNLPLIQSTKEIRGVGNLVSHSTHLCELQVKSRINSYSMRLQCFVLNEITPTLPAVQVHNTQLKVPDNVQLANTQFLGPQKIDILLGADRFWDLLIDGKMRLPNGPFLQNTKLGWIISGPINHNISEKYGHIQCNFSQSIDDQLRQFWELEELTQPRNTHTDEELVCEQNFVTNTTRDNHGRFVVNIPLKKSAEVLGESYSQAERRFLALEKRLLRAPVSYKQLYIDFMREYAELGHMTKVDTYSNPNYFLPHHGVFREHSTTTKLRVVFDASAATNNGISFNDIQLVGPPIQGDLLSILLRFRQYRFCALADCEKMYRQVLVNPSQRELQLIIWRDDPSKPLELYRLNTVTYGTASAPFLSVRCLKQLAAECSEPEVKRVINDDFYVDDLLTSCEDKVKLLNICKGTVDALKSGCFSLRKWVFNFDLSEDAYSTFANDNNRDTFHNLNLGQHCQCKTLGLGWCNFTDEFYFNTQLQQDSTSVTKRTILSTVSQLFDPLGLLSPSIIIGKVLLQRLWLLKLQWDDPLPTDILRTWNRFLDSMSYLSSIKIPRYAFQCNATQTELHIFTDASQTAYGACAYVRTVCGNRVVVKLLISKGKVAPLKPVSIPRLELCGALLGAKLFNKISSSLTRKFDDIIFWTDSTIVLGWLRMTPNLLKTFVQNRVAEIHELTSGFTWRHVSGKDNPADLVSRGVSLEDLALSKLWWEGPTFLHEHNLNLHLKSDSKELLLNNNLPELKSNVINSFLFQNNNSYETFFPFNRFSNFNRMSHTVVYVLRFAHNCKQRNKTDQLTGAISVDELNRAVITLARLSQRESFSLEYDLLRSGKNIKSNNRLSSLNLFLDKNDLIRVGGRLKNSVDFNFNKKHPILLCSKHYFTRLLFIHEHNQSMHCGPQALLYRLREHWWPLSGRNLARKVTHQCVICTRVKGKTLSPLMGNLPKERLTVDFPFICAGVDYAGPVFVLNRKGKGAKLTKSYICLFICFTTPAIHLELVSDLSTDAYLLALKRFVSRRGKPCQIFSDNGRNFVGLNNDFAQFLSSCSKDIADYARSQNIKFSFIPPYSPHFGGLWEAGVKSCKYHLRRVVGGAHLTFEELATVLSQIEAVLNSRPLSPMSSDPSDYTPLSPGHFLIGRPLTAPVCEDDIHHLPVYRLSRYQRVEQLRQQFWRRWAREYISELQTRAKWKQNTAELKPDTLVLIKDVTLPPLRWQLGRVVKTIPGNDGIARVADIRTSSGIVRRSYSNICPLVEQE